MSDFKINSIATKQGQHGPVIAGVSTVNSTGCMKIPSGPTEFRGGRGRGISAGGSPGPLNIDMEFLTIASAGNGQDFGDLSSARNNLGASASSTRAVFAGGSEPTYITNIEYATISSLGGVADFGELTKARMPFMSNSNNTISITYGGYDNVNLNTIDFVTIASTGDATDFGSDNIMRRSVAATGNTTRAVIFGGYGDQNFGQSQTPIGPMAKISFNTYATKGDSIPFGELSFKVYGAAGVSNETRGIFAGGYDYRSPVLDTKNEIEFITIASEGNGTDFGDLTAARRSHGGMSNSIRGLFVGGYTPTVLNTIDFITIASAGNAQDFGDLLAAKRSNGCCTDSHGGIGE